MAGQTTDSLFTEIEYQAFRVLNRGTPNWVAEAAATKYASVLVPNINKDQEFMNINPSLVLALAWQESWLRPGIVGSSGELGPCQLMPRHPLMGIFSIEEVQTIEGGAMSCLYAIQLAKEECGRQGFPTSWLRFHNTGTCRATPRGNQYARQVCRKWSRLDPPNANCSRRTSGRYPQDRVGAY